ncbi:DEAD/DEAH box helicase [Bulleidia sp. zg-1006]|uniref:DEAD/DEAH box helicase n=1 Tax=Bulleidia sp. zg-1006 TaxID=2806552 RepID=UPI001939C03C|nr:DEAD/DEAH box helicase [Bulleidia sp. zg-1006]QRG86030.1 DEAD/DEAH box helicase [Bulleidia sp. zg-1006]
MKKFEDLHIQEPLKQWLRDKHFKEMTAIQEEVIPLSLQGKDIIGLSETGSGKTHAFLVPIFEKIDVASDYVQAVITAPTRELAYQIYAMAKEVEAYFPSIRISAVVGGKERARDSKKFQLQQPHVVIGTPGRLRDLFLEDNSLRLDKAKVMVVDEADMTLEFGFLADVDAIVSRMNDVQMLSFSATLPNQLKPFIRKYMHHPITIEIGKHQSNNKNIEHVLVPCYHRSYAETILKIMPGFNPYVCLIFANSRKEAHEIAQELRDHGVKLTELHGDLSSRERKQAMKQITQSQYEYVIATDLAARGMDIGEVGFVISCGFPNDLEYYIHRAGRTGRAGLSGTCYALYHEQDDEAIRSLMKQGIPFKHRRFHHHNWQDLRPYGQRRAKKDTEMQKQIAKMMTKKKRKVKPGYKKKREAEIDKLYRRKKRDFIRSKIKEEKKARYKQRAKELRDGNEKA